jgi:uncharacterized protein (TIRG00374 family)
MRRARSYLAGRMARAVLGLGISSVFIVFFLRHTDFSGVGDAFGEADIALILIAIGVYFAGLYVRAIRWHYLLRHVKPIAPHKLFPIMAIGFGTNNVLPFRAGEVVRAHTLYRRHGIARATGISSIFMARVYDGLMLTVFLAVGVVASLVDFEGMTYAGDLLVAAMAFLIFGVGSAFVLIYLIASHPQRAADLVRAQSKRIPGLRQRNLAWLDSLIEGLGATGERNLFLGAVWTSALAWGLEAFMYYLVGEAFGLGLPFPVYLLIAAAANIIITAPTTSGGVGPFEWATKEVLLIYAAGSGAEESAIAFAASLHGLVLLPIALVGLLFLWIYQIPLWRLGSESEQGPVTQPR